MPTVQTVVFENVEIDISNNKQLFIHPIHRVVAEAFPVALKVAVLSCCYDMKAGQYSCRHSLLTGDKRRKIFDYAHEPVSLQVDGGGMGFRTLFENLQIDSPGKFWIRTEVPGIRCEDIPLRIEIRTKMPPRLNVKA
ncbi:MAG: hypothetical protein KGR26_07575 [Cyanobacteria bacterium REEB65]|nr:hypothetical protein [Cyanobacteria bacterium REEB65]